MREDEGSGLVIATQPDGARRVELVGREMELGRIDLFLGRPWPAALVLEGEAGIGKTELWEIAVDRARRSATVLTWRASEAERTLGFAGASGLFDRYAAAGWLERLPRPRDDALAAALGLRRTEGPPPEPTLLGLAVADLLRAIAADGRLLIGVDDTQWLDEPSKAALAFAVRRLADVPIGLVLAERTGQAIATMRDPAATHGAASELIAALPAEQREHLVVGPLSVGALGRLLHDRLGITHPRPLLQRLHDAVNGNPFLAQEASRSLSKRHLAPGPAEPLPIPAETGALVRDHLATLGPAARRAALLVAMAFEPTRRVVADVLGADADTAIDGAVAGGILISEGPALRPAHPLFASIVYADALPSERRMLHGRLAEIATASGRAIEAAVHLGSSVDEPDATVAAAIASGAAEAAARGTPALAAQLFERAAALSNEPGARAPWTAAAAAQSLAAGDAERAEALLRATLERDAIAGPVRAEALAALGEIVYVRSPAEGLALLRSALEHVGDDRRLEALIHAYIVGMADSDLEHGIRSADRAVELLDGLDGVPRNQLAAALLDRAFQWLLLGERVAVDDIDRGLELLDLDESSFLERRAEESGERCLWLIGRLEDAMALDEAQYRRFVERGQLGLLPQLLQAMATMRLYTGRPDLAERYTLEIEELVESGEELWRERGVMARVWVEAYAGELDAAREAAVAALARQEAEGDLWEAVIYASVLGFIELSAGEPSLALQWLTLAMERNDAMQVGLPNAGTFLRDYVEATVLVGRIDLAEVAVSRFETAAARLGLPSEVVMAARGRGLIDLASGATERAIERFDEALAILELSLPLPLERGRVLLHRADALRRLGRRREARAGIETAMAIFGSIGARAWAARARAELGRLGGRTPAGGALTSAERAVADLAAGGLSNREIAARLVVSVRTVENQLSAVYGKLEVSSRRQLPAALRRSRDI